MRSGLELFVLGYNLLYIMTMSALNIIIQETKIQGLIQSGLAMRTQLHQQYTLLYLLCSVMVMSVGPSFLQLKQAFGAVLDAACFRPHLTIHQWHRQIANT